MLNLNEKKGVGILIGIGLSVIVVITILDMIYDWTEIGNEYTIIIEIMVGMIIAYIAITRTDRDTNTIKQLVSKINEYEEKQKEFLGELEKTRNSRLSFYGSKLVGDFTKIQKCFAELENLPESELAKLDRAFFEKFKPAHVITTTIQDRDIEILNLPFFLVMKADLSIIESDLPPEISYLAGKTIEMSQICLNGQIRTKDKLWELMKNELSVVIDRLNSLIIDKKSLKDYGVHFYRFDTNARLNSD